MGLGEAFLRIVGAIAALVLVLFLAWLLLRWLNGRMPGTRSAAAGKMIQVLDRMSLGRTSGVVLLRVHTRVLLVGYSDRQTQTLAEFEDPEGEICAVQDLEAVGFADALKNAAKQMGFGPKKGQDKGEDE